MYTNNCKNAIIFGLPESQEEYVQDSVRKTFFCARTNEKTNKFYLSLGFKELEIFPDLWDKWNPCQIYIMAV